jgi:hypothetical protein
MTKVAFGLLLPTVEAMQIIFTKMVWGDFSKFSQKWFGATFCAIFPNTHLVNLILGNTLQMEFRSFPYPAICFGFRPSKLRESHMKAFSFFSFFGWNYFTKKYPCALRAVF